ncbi:MAG: hypothetical protein J7485_05355 [Sphingobium sp.]|nr:hypothetical protein [Sphingobium sp.]
MTRYKNLLAVVPAAIALFAVQASAHHSFAMFDQTKTVTLKGKVVEFQWTNPHAFIELEAPGDNGASDRWSLELNSPNNLTRQGWRRSSVKPGDTVSVTFNPLRNGKKGGLFKSVVLPGGRVLGDAREAPDKAINVPTAN